MVKLKNCQIGMKIGVVVDMDPVIMIVDSNQVVSTPAPPPPAPLYLLPKGKKAKRQKRQQKNTKKIQEQKRKIEEEKIPTYKTKKKIII